MLRVCGMCPAHAPPSSGNGRLVLCCGEGRRGEHVHFDIPQNVFVLISPRSIQICIKQKHNHLSDENTHTHKSITLHTRSFGAMVSVLVISSGEVIASVFQCRRPLCIALFVASKGSAMV